MADCASSVPNPSAFCDASDRARLKPDLSWESLDAWATGGVNLGGATEPIRVTAASVTGGLFPLLGVSPELGRAITPQDDVPGAPLTAVISHDLWQRAFAGDRGVVGRVIQVDGANANIVGVMPQSFSFPPGELDPPEIWAPIQLPPPNPQRRGSHFLYLVGRLKPGVSLHVAQDEIARHVQQSPARLGQNHPFDPGFHPIVAYGLQDEVVRTIRPALWTLMGAVAFVLLIACVNVANLLLARAEARQREIAVRKALGASTGQLIRQFTTEGLLLSLGGAVLGLALAMAGLKVMVAAGKASIPRASEVGIDPTVLAVTIAVSLLTALFFGLAPLAQIAGGTLHDALKAAAGRGTAGSVASNRFRSALVSSELALALVLLIGTGLMIRAFWKLSEVQSRLPPRRSSHRARESAPRDLSSDCESNPFLAGHPGKNQRDSRRHVRHGYGRPSPGTPHRRQRHPNRKFHARSRRPR